MYLMIDNFDSFVYNLKAYFEEMGRCVTVKRCDRISLQDVEDLEPEGIILSPGPGRPWETKMCVDVVNMYKVDAISEDGAVMGISHRRLPLYGVQFHPEAVLTEYGHDVLYNFCIAAEKFNCR